MKPKTSELIELQGPGGRCKIPAAFVSNYLNRKGWKVVEKPVIDTRLGRVTSTERGNYEIGFEKDFYDFIPHDETPINNRHKGETIFILGDGPSLQNVPKAILEQYTTIGANRVNLYYTPTYQIATDSRMLFNHRNPFQSSRTQKFWLFSHYYTHDEFNDPHTRKAQIINSYNPEGMFYRYKIDEGYTADKWSRTVFSKNFKQGLRIGRTIAIPMINLAYIMGAKRICLFGIDMNNNNHFYKPLNDRQEKEQELKYPHFDVIIESFEKINKFFKKRRIKIFNMNPDSAVRVFPFAELDWKVKIKEIKDDSKNI